MSLLKPTPGQMYDRILILSLKIEAAKSSHKSIDALQQEDAEIRGLLLSMNPCPNKGILELTRKLGDVNSQLWEREDSIRYGDNQDSYHVAQIARDIARLNDQRNSIIREIDKAYGCENPVEEKIYLCTAKK